MHKDIHETNALAAAVHARLERLLTGTTPA